VGQGPVANGTRADKLVAPPESLATDLEDVFQRHFGGAAHEDSRRGSRAQARYSDGTAR